MKTTFACCSLLVASLSGCGLFKVTVNGETAGKSPDAATATDSSSAQSTGHSAPESVAAREVALPPDMSEPLVLTGDDAEEHSTVRLSSKAPRTISVFLFDGVGHVGPGNDRDEPRIEHRTVTPDAPLELRIKSKPRDKDLRVPYRVIVVDDAQTKLTFATAIQGRPPEGSDIAQSEWTKYSLLSTFLGQALLGGEKLRSPGHNADLFTAIDDDFFVFVKQQRTCNDTTGALMPTEPLLVEHVDWSYGEVRGVRLRRANGELSMCYLDDLAAALTKSRPASITMPPPIPVRVSETENLWSPEKFLPLAAENPRIAAYQERKAKVEACFDREWDKLDPDHTASHYDVVSRGNDGKVRKVESLSAQLNRKVDKRCNLSGLEAERAAIRKELRQNSERESAAAMARIEGRFGA